MCPLSPQGKKMLKIYSNNDIQKFINMYNDMQEFFQYVWQKWYNYIYDTNTAEIESRDMSTIKDVWIENKHLKIKWESFINNDGNTDNIPLDCLFEYDIEDQILIDLIKK